MAGADIQLNGGSIVGFNLLWYSVGVEFNNEATNLGIARVSLMAPVRIDAPSQRSVTVWGGRSLLHTGCELACQ